MFVIPSAKPWISINGCRTPQFGTHLAEREQGKGLEWRADHKYWQFLHQAPHSASSSHNGMHSPEMEDIEFCRWFSLLNWFALDLMALKVCSKKAFCEKVGIQFWSKVGRTAESVDLSLGSASLAITRGNPQPSFFPSHKHNCRETWKYCESYIWEVKVIFVKWKLYLESKSYIWKVKVIFGKWKLNLESEICIWKVKVIFGE